MKHEYSVPEVARIYKVGRASVWRWVKSGRLPSYQLPSGRNRIRHRDLVALMKQDGVPIDMINEAINTRVLIVDDEPQILSILAAAFSRQQRFEVKTESDCINAGMSIKEFIPHIIILDIILGNVDGRELCKRIRQDPDLEDTVIVAISGKIDPQEEQHLLDIGFNAFFRKPFNIRSFVTAVKRLLSDS